MPSGTEMTAATPMRMKEAPMRSPSSSATEPPDAEEVPKSPTKSPPSQVRYRSQAGLSRPSCSLSAAIRSGVACWPRMARAASPGSSRVAPKTSSETAMRMKAEKISLRTMTFPNMSHLSDPHAVEPPPAQGPARGVGDEPADVLLEGVDLVGEAPDDVAAFVVEHLLQFVLHIATLPGVGDGPCLVEDLVEIRVVPVGLVEWRLAQGAGDHLRHEVSGVPEVLGEVPLQVFVAEERRRVHLADLDRDSGLGGLLGEDLRSFDGAGLDGGGDEFDLESVGVAGLGEELLRFVDVLLALGEVRIVLTQRPEHVVADSAEPGQDLFDHLLPVDDEPEGLPDLDVVEGLLVDTHGERQPHASLGVEDAHALVGVDDLDQRQRDAGDGVDLCRQQRVDESVVVVEVQHLDLVEVHLVVVEVVLVGHEHSRLGGGEGFEFERPGAHRVLRVVA